MPRRARLPRQPDIRRDPAGHRHQPGGGQPGLRPPGLSTRPTGGARRPHRPALRHQHGEPVRLCVSGDAAGEADGHKPGPGSSRSGDPLVASRADRLPGFGVDRMLRCLHRQQPAALAASRSPALHPGWHCPRLHRLGLPAAHLRPTGGGAGSAGRDPGGLLRPGALAGARRPGGRAAGHRPGLGQWIDRPRSGALAEQHGPDWAPHTQAAAGRPVAGARPASALVRGDRADGTFQCDRLAAKPGERRSRRRSLSGAQLDADQWHRHPGRRHLGLLLSHHHLHRPPGLEGHGRPHWLLLAQWRGDGRRLPAGLVWSGRPTGAD